jgi:hypothetical protein
MRAGQAARKCDHKHPYIATQPLLVQPLIVLAFARPVRIGATENDPDRRLSSQPTKVTKAESFSNLGSLQSSTY